MKHTIDNILGACGFVKEENRKGVKLISYKGYEAPDGVEISLEVNAGGPFVFYVQIDREALGVKKEEPVNNTQVMLLKEVKIVKSRFDKSRLLKRVYTFATGPQKGQEFSDLTHINRRPGIILSFFHLLGYRVASMSDNEFKKTLRKIRQSKKPIYLAGRYKVDALYKIFTPDYLCSKPKRAGKK